MVCDKLYDGLFGTLMSERGGEMMLAENMKLYAPNLICICVNARKQGDYVGEIWNQYDEEPKAFHTSLDMIQKMDDLYDRWDFPQRSTMNRRFDKVIVPKQQERTPRKGAIPKMDADRIQDKKGEKGTFIVHVLYRQNATWQGEVVWADKKKKQRFRSALELLKLMDSALDADESDCIEDDV